MTSENPPHVALCFTDLLGRSQSSQVDQITTRGWTEVAGARLLAWEGVWPKNEDGHMQTLLVKSVRTVMVAGWRTCLLKVKRFL